MPQWNAVTPQFSRGITTAMSNASDSVNKVGAMAHQYLADVKEQERYDTAQARQKVLDDRATELYNRDKSDREGRIFVNKIAGETLPHLLSQDTAVQGMDGILGQANADRTALLGQGESSTLAGVRIGGGTYQVPTQSQQVVNLPRPNPEVGFNVQTRVPDQKLPGKSKLAQVVEGILPVSGIGNVAKAINGILPDPAVTKLLNTPGMYTTIPGSSAKDLNAAGEEALRKGVIPGGTTLKGVKTNLDSIDFNTPVDKQGKAYGHSSKGQAFFTDTQTGKLVPEGAVTKAIAGVDMKPQRVETIIGSKTVRVPGIQQATLSSIKSGANPQQVQAVNQNITDGYNKILGMLPKDNTARREELRGVISALAADRGLDPKDFDINKTLDSFLPKTEVSDVQKSAMNVTMKALDQNLDQINKNREYSLQERKFAADEAYKNASLSLEKIKMSMQDKWHKDEASAKAQNQTVPMYKILPNGQHEIVKVPIGSATQMEKAGYKPGTLAGSRITTPTSKDGGKSAVDLMALGGSQLLGGTSGIDLVTLAKRMKAENPKVPQSAIDTEIANLSQGWLTDSVNLSELRKNLQGYQK